jgi:hypothetical protein
MDTSIQPMLTPNTCHYYVDEAGDPTLFNAKGKVIIGQEGCSRYMMLGLLQVSHPVELSNSLNELRQNLLTDPYFRKIPSMQPDQRKTALMFHAKDDIPEVRKEVFSELLRHDLKFFAVVRDKTRGILREVRTYKNKRYHPNEQYDRLVKRLFTNRLHKESEYSITFATRGAKDRTRALGQALAESRKRFEKKWAIHSDAPIHIENVPAHQNTCLQAADYLSWALQRCYERREDRYLDFVWPIYRLVHDVDDRRKSKTGVYYNQTQPLMLEALQPLALTD